ncbi:MAG: DUF979 family protein [Xanthomonadales bacterium]|nr:hypothetical protein [Xanthomonadales bacterium]MCC6594063.1 DUF979 family protein [Xanthomonadales bacterium]MCE7930893.1 DUF979 family protein [Xanthomonadales bacterium PRO6]
MSLTPIYWLLGGYFALIAVRAWRDRERPARIARAGFFAMLSLLYLVGDWLPPALAGVGVLAIALIAGFGLPLMSAIAPAANGAAGHPRLLLPVLAIPAITIMLTLTLPYWRIDDKPVLGGHLPALFGLTCACLLALALALRLTREKAALALARGGDLVEAIGWAILLPLLLAVLGTLFSKAGVGDALARAIGALVPLDVRWVAVVAYGLGMALLTMAMGNAFAAFPVIAGGIGLPFLMQVHGADPAPLAAVGMLSGYCGTLMTPMAANFNLVPVALLDLKDRNAVIRAQIPTAIPLLAANLMLLGVLCFR